MLATSLENTDAAASAIMDADIASEQAELASNEVKTQAAIAALAQANQLPQELLDLLR
jgi:flagellin